MGQHKRKEETKYTLERAQQDYALEFAGAIAMKRNGITSVSAETAGEELAEGRKTIPIDEYIESWKLDLKILLSGDPDIDPEAFNY